MKRREILLTAAAAAFPLRNALGTEGDKPKVLYFTRSVGFEHSAVRRQGDALSSSEKILIDLGRENGIQVECSKDGRIFDGDLDQYAAFAFYTCGDLCHAESKDGAPPMSTRGKQNLLDAVAAGKGFVGFHSAADSFHSQGDRNTVQTQRDPYVAMLGGEFVKHGPQQTATMRVTAPDFPGMADAGASFDLNEEWYALKNFADDMRVIMVQETEGMRGNCYGRPPFPATWARRHGKGRVYYTSLGHREDVWTNPLCQQIVMGGFAWVLGDQDADLTSNLATAAPKCDQLSSEL